MYNKLQMSQSTILIFDTTNTLILVFISRVNSRYLSTNILEVLSITDSSYQNQDRGLTLLVSPHL